MTKSCPVVTLRLSKHHVLTVSGLKYQGEEFTHLTNFGARVAWKKYFMTILPSGVSTYPGKSLDLGLCSERGMYTCRKTALVILNALHSALIATASELPTKHRFVVATSVQ